MPNNNADSNIDDFIDAWIIATESRGKKNQWTLSEIDDWIADREFKRLWSFVQKTYSKNVSDDVLNSLAAGPLEDLLVYAGEEFIEEIELLAKTDLKLKQLLRGVWQNSMKDSVWQAIVRISK